MVRVFTAACLTLELLSTAASAQGFVGDYPTLPTSSSGTGLLSANAGPIQPSDLVSVSRVTPASFGANGLTIQTLSELPLSAFASSSDVATLTSQVAQVRSEIRAQADSTRSKLANGVALAGAMDMIRPAAGASNRFGGQVSDYDGRAAAAFSYMRQSGAFDMGVAGGFASGAAMGKLSAGVSW